MKKTVFIFAIIMAVLYPVSIQAQDQETTVTGTIIDETGELLPGAVVYVENKPGVGTITNENGQFSIKARKGEVLVASFVGYDKVKYRIENQIKDIIIQFQKSSQELEEVVVVGMGSTQRKISSVAAISTVNVKELQSPAPSIANMLGGRVAGLFTMQSSGEPGKNLADFWVRGIGTFGANSGALVLIDGLEGDLNSIDPADLESFSILKDASATAVYGVRGANGVILITTKKGESGKLSITGRANVTLSRIRRLPEYMGAYEYAQLANEANVVRGGDPIYTPIELEIIKDNLDPDMYPNVNWQDVLLRDNSWKNTYYVSGRGGGEIARYFLSLGMTNETATYNVDKSSIYGQNVGYNTYNFRTNLDIDLTKTTKLYFGSDGFMSRSKTPGFGSTYYIWNAQARNNPLLVPIQYSTGQYPATGADMNMSPWVMINRSGSYLNENYSAKITLAINQDLNFLTKGLRVRAQGAYDVSQYFEERRFILPAMYQAIGRNRNGELILVERIQETRALYANYVDQYRKYFFESSLNYERLFDEKHRVSGLVYYYISDSKATKDATNHLSSIPLRYQGVSSRITYGLWDTYLVDVNFGYTGSENFQPGRQYGFFPSVAIGWIPTQYEFIKDKLPWMDFFKIRASYGTVGNDRITDRRFPYLTMLSREYRSIFGMSASYQTVNESFIGADNLIWEKALKGDIGIEGKFLKEKISFVVDFFQDQRDGIFQQRVQVPDIVGVTNMPYGNVGKMKSFGSDGNIAYKFDINNSMWFTLRGNYSYSRNIVQNWEQQIEKYPYLERSGWPHDVYRGYRSLGLFKDEDDIKYSPRQTFGTVMPGDIKYMDVNGDGKVDSEDRVPLSFNTYPKLMYGIGFEYGYKNLSVGALLKGTGKVDYYREGVHDNDLGGLNGMGYVPFKNAQYGNVLKIAADPRNRWIPLDYAVANGIDPSLAENPNAIFPRLSYGNSSNNEQLSDFWKGDARYLRLQEITVSYNLRHQYLRKLGIASIDLQLIGNNLFVWDKVKMFDPEQASKNGRVYPIPTTYSFQLYIHL